MEINQALAKNSLTATMHTNLEKQMQLCRGFLCLLKEEQNALVTMDIHALMRYSRKKEELLHHIHNLDNSIQETTLEMAQEYRSKPKTLSQLLPLLPREKAGELNKFRKKLFEIREEIQVRNMVNKQFTEDTLSYISDAIDLITGTGKEPSVYAAQKISHKKTCDPTLLSREV